MGGKVRQFVPHDYPPYIYIKQLFSHNHFMTNIRAYNQMFAMTSLRATVDETVNVGRGTYVFKVSGQIYHQIGYYCPDESETPRFLQLYIYDTPNEVTNRLSHFGNNAAYVLREDIVEGLIQYFQKKGSISRLLETMVYNDNYYFFGGFLLLIFLNVNIFLIHCRLSSSI
jgi:hypothetical protein